MKSELNTVTLSIELKEEIYRCMQDFLASNSDWNRKRLIDVSMSLFLSQNSSEIKLEDYLALAEKIYLQSV